MNWLPTLVWHKHIGDQGDAIGPDRFGAYSPGSMVMCKYGLTADLISQQTLAPFAKRGA
jgi:transketolase